MFAPAFAGLIDNASGFFTATQLQPRINNDEFICDLRVKVFADLTETLPFTTLFIRIDPNNSHDAEFFNCKRASTISTFDLVDFQFRNPDPLAVFIFDETIHSQIVLRDKEDSTQKVDAFTQPQLRRELQIDAGIVSLPLNMDVEFVVTNIPLRDYILEIYYGREINSMDAGEPFITSITGNQ